MNQTINTDLCRTKCKPAICALTIVALALISLSLLSYFIYDTGYAYGSGLRLRYPDISDLIFINLRLAAPVLTLLYFFVFHSRNKAHALMPIVFGIIAFTSTFSQILNFFNSSGISFNSFASFLLYVSIYSLPFGLAMIDAFKHFSTRVFLIIAFISGSLSGLSTIVTLVSNASFYIEYGLFFGPVMTLLSVFGSSALYVALFIFGIANGAPRKGQTADATINALSPAQALSLLDDKLELGIITEDEYISKREEIIGNL